MGSLNSPKLHSQNQNIVLRLHPCSWSHIKLDFPSKGQPEWLLTFKAQTRVSGFARMTSFSLIKKSTNPFWRTMGGSGKELSFGAWPNWKAPFGVEDNSLHLDLLQPLQNFFGDDPGEWICHPGRCQVASSDLGEDLYQTRTSGLILASLKESWEFSFGKGHLLQKCVQ